MPTTPAEAGRRAVRYRPPPPDRHPPGRCVPTALSTLRNPAPHTRSGLACIWCSPASTRWMRAHCPPHPPQPRPPHPGRSLHCSPASTRWMQLQRGAGGPSERPGHRARRGSRREGASARLMPVGCAHNTSGGRQACRALSPATVRSACTRWMRAHCPPNPPRPRTPHPGRSHLHLVQPRIHQVDAVIKGGRGSQRAAWAPCEAGQWKRRCIHQVDACRPCPQHLRRPAGVPCAIARPR